MPPTSRREFLSFWRPKPAPVPQHVPVSSPPPAVTSSSEPLRLPPLQQTTLDVATTDALFRDIAACTTVQAVLPKYARNAHTGPDVLTLEQARTRLAAGLLLGVQIRYTFEGQAWTDTLLRRPTGLTLVRIREADIAATLEAAS
jgi:hypothetical protein